MNTRFWFSFLLFFANTSSVIFAQEKEAYLFFNQDKSEKIKVINEDGETSEIDKYRKIIQENGNIDFYIGQEVFTHYPKSKIDTCKNAVLKHVKLSKVCDLYKTWEKSGLFLNTNVFNTIYILEKENDSFIIKYEVKWQYIE